MLSIVNNQIISDLEPDDYDVGLLEPALIVSDDSGDDAYNRDIPPTTGNDYLRRVRDEARKCPQVVVANVDVSQYKHKQTIKLRTKDTMPAPKGYGPTAAWVKKQVDDFVALRQKMMRFKSLLAKNKVSVADVTLPEQNDAESWCRLCFGRLQLKTKTEEGEDTEAAGSMHTAESLQNDGTGMPPLLSIVARMDQPTVIKVLEYHVNWLEATGFTHKQGQWFYSLLAVLQKPLTPESCSWLRQLARICSIIRATQNSPEDAVLLELNLLICLVAHYFNQTDMADKT